MQWLQNYTSLGNAGLTALVVAIPIFFLFWALAIKRMKGHVAGLLTLLIAIIDVVLVYKMPVGIAVSSTILGAVNGLFPIGWIIITAVFLYNLTVEAGQFEIIKSSISSISSDRRMQALLIAFAFSAFMEGAAGQGAPVAIAAAMLVGLGFNPLWAAVICLVANVPPVPFGPVGTPTIMMSSVTGINENILAAAVGREVSIIAMIIPFAMLIVMVGWKKTAEVLPAVLVAGISFTIPFYLVTNYLGPTLPSIVAPIVCLISLTVFLRFWKPKSIWRFPDDPDLSSTSEISYTGGQIFKAWSPFLVLTLIMGFWGTPLFKNWVAKDLQWFVNIPHWPGLDGLVYKTAPIVSEPSVYAASYKWDFFAAPGTAMLFAAIISMVILKMSPQTGIKVFTRTLKQLAFSLLTIASVLGLAYLANYSGMSYTLGLAFASTGAIFPVFSPILGWLGVFLTGSVTSSAALFGKLQQVTAGQLGLNPILTVSASLTGGIMGKLISPQSIAIACAAVGLVGRETDIFRRTFKYSVILLAIVIVMILIFAYVIPGVLPVVTSAVG
ncbi:L-lactate permease [Desulfosporosinus lacus]|uniref:L-lactate permease n=1 Tax=Desulfosporosinus lacus DSM 15449 TaxID=1121420 RepID=A0A1M5ZNN7_9FIRM|nr:lactate permease LctP family transporter [Desulfosporosinus lacus]SHI25804.1 lactate permease [Desulfosporosinus lacus DSM 15449]